MTQTQTIPLLAGISTPERATSPQPKTVTRPFQAARDEIVRINANLARFEERRLLFERGVRKDAA